MTHHELQLFGVPQAAYGGVPLTFSAKKAWALLVYLLLEGDRLHSRSALAAMLWPESPSAKAHNSLSVALTQLRGMIARPDAPHLPIIATPQTLQRNPLAEIVLDVERFDAVLDSCAAHRHRDMPRCLACARHLAEALALVRGEFLEGLAANLSPSFEDWLVMKRSRLSVRIYGVRLTLVAHHEQRGDSGAALDCLRRLLVDAPWDEDVNRHAMRILAQSGQRTAALKQYQDCVAVLDHEFGMPPSAETDELAGQIRAGTLRPPLRPALGLPTGLPLLVGRRAELRALTDTLSDVRHRLVTICGPSRIGKTHLAIKVADMVGPSYGDGARMVDLAAAPTADDIVTAVGAAVGLAFHSAEPNLDQLLTALADVELLLLLDDADQLRAHAALLDKLLQGAPGVTLLVTARTCLAHPAEWAYALGERAGDE